MDNEQRTVREARDDSRVDRGDALMDRIDLICDRLTDKMNAMALTLNTVDIGLRNHLAHHEKFEKNFLYPIAISIVLVAGAIVWSIIRSHL